LIRECVIIRRIHANELYRVYEIETKSFSREAYPFNLFYFYYLLARDLFLVAEFLGKTIGYAIGVIEEKNGFCYGHVISIAVEPLYRGFGVGEKLMLCLEDRMRGYGASKVYLEVRVDNEPAISLYKKLGYRIIDRIRGYYYGEVDAYVMAKNIRQTYTTH